MDISKLPVGKDVPENVNVVIEIPVGGQPVKYEMDKESGALFVDRFMHSAMRYPANYGFIPHTLSDDGDPVDVLVISPVPFVPLSVVRCRPIGMMLMEDESGGDEKLVAVPVSKLHPSSDAYKEYTDLPEQLLAEIKHFFEHYKDLEKGKWVKVAGWKSAAEAKQAVLDGVARYNKESKAA